MLSRCFRKGRMINTSSRSNYDLILKRVVYLNNNINCSIFSYLLESFSIILIELLLSQLEDRDSDDEEFEFRETGEYLLFLFLVF